MSDHGTYEEHAALYALGALDGADLVAYEIHRRECVACRRAEADYARVATGIVPQGPAPETLRARVEAALPRKAGGGSLFIRTLGVAAVLLLGTTAFVQSHRISQLNAAFDEEAQANAEAVNRAKAESASLRRTIVDINQQLIESRKGLDLSKAEVESLRKTITSINEQLMASRTRADELGKIVVLAQKGTPVRLKSDKVEGLVYYDPKGGGVVFFADMKEKLKETEHLVLWMIKEGADPLNVAHCSHEAPYGMTPQTPAAMAETVQTFALSVETDPETKAPKGPVIVAGPVK